MSTNKQESSEPPGGLLARRAPLTHLAQRSEDTPRPAPHAAPTLEVLLARPITQLKYTHTHTHILHPGRWKLGRTQAIRTSCRTALEKKLLCTSIDIHAVLSKDSIVIQTGTRVSSVQLASFYKTASQASRERGFMHFSKTFPVWLSWKYAPEEN